MKKAAFLSVATLLLATCAFGQGGGNAAITGTVTDPTGAVIPGATVTVNQEGTGVKRSTVTNSSGYFAVPSLIPSKYSLSVQVSGFKGYLVHVTLLADETRALSIQLVVGQVTESVTVEATSVLVNSVTPVLNQVIEQSRVVDLPLNGRNAADLTRLVAGTTGANGHGTEQGNTKQIPGTESISVNGARPDQISYNLDGASNQDVLSNTNSPFPFPDAVQEFSVQTNSFNAQYGQNAGAVVNVVTKSGTNKWHGDLFEFLRNKNLNARSFNSPVRDGLKRNQFGFTLGGPIVKDRTFFFGGYQGTRIRSLQTGLSAFVPTNANLQGDFSAFLDAKNPNNPAGAVRVITDPQTGKPFPGNLIAVGRFDSVALNFVKLVPRVDGNGRVLFTRPIGQDFDQYVFRGDQVVRGVDKLTFRLIETRFTNVPGFDGVNLLSVSTGSLVQTGDFQVAYIWVPGPHLVNHTSFNFQRETSQRGQGGNVPSIGDLGAKGLLQLPKSEGGIRGFGVSGFFGVGDFTDARFNRNIYALRDDATWTWRDHTFSFGGDYEHDQVNIRNTDLENGTFNFTNDTDGLSLASFLLGRLRQFQQTSGDFSDSRQDTGGIFFADKWRFNRRLSFDLGLRYEPQVPIQEVRGRITQFCPGNFASGTHSSVFPNLAAGLIFIGDSCNGRTVPPGGQDGDLNNFAPRAGFAYDLFGNGKTVIRGGGGIFYNSRVSGLFLNDAVIQPPFSFATSVINPTGLLSAPIGPELAAFEASFPNRFTFAGAPRNVQFTGLAQVFGFQPGLKFTTPQTDQWNVTLEHQWLADTVVRASYVGSHGSHLREDINLNPAQFRPGDDAFNKLSTDKRRVFPGFSNILEDAHRGNSSYNALQIGLEKRPRPGSEGIFKNVTLLVNYTYSKSIDDIPASGGGITDIGSSVGSGRPFGDPLQFSFDRGVSDFDHTHILVASWVWNLPSFRNATHPALKWVLGDWQWSGIYTARSGNALTILAGTDQSKTNLNGDRARFLGSADQLGGGARGTGGCGATEAFCVPFLNSALFTAPPVGQFGNLGKDTFRGPGNWNFDFGLFKNITPISSAERFKIQFRAEFLNAFNHTQIGDPTVTRSSSGFGGIRGTANGGRIIQLALKLFF